MCPWRKAWMPCTSGLGQSFISKPIVDPADLDNAHNHGKCPWLNREIEKYGSWDWIPFSLLESRLFKAQISWLYRPDRCSWRRGMEIGASAWQGREQTLVPLPQPIRLPFVLGWQETAGDTGREMGRGINQVSVGKGQLGRGEMLVPEHPVLNAGTYPRDSYLSGQSS